MMHGFLMGNHELSLKKNAFIYKKKPCTVIFAVADKSQWDLEMFLVLENR